jgi:hypothetical protein
MNKTEFIPKPSVEIPPCPACGTPVHFSRHVPLSPVIWAYCGNGTCKSKVANNGAAGATPHLAYKALEKAIAQEREEHPERFE